MRSIFRLSCPLSRRGLPPGFGFALAESVEYLDGAAWDSLTADAGNFMARRY